jgi:hypothetical protein
MPRPSHSRRRYPSNYTWRGVQITKLVVMQFSQLYSTFRTFSRHFDLATLAPRETAVIYRELNFESRRV